MPKKQTTTAAPAADQTEAVALSRIPAFQPIELEIVRDILPLKGRQYELTTEAGMIEAKADLKTITSYLTRLEQARKVTKDEPFRLCQLIDSEAKRISAPIEEEIKEPLRAAIKEEEGRLARIEAARVEAIRKRIAEISRRPAWGAKAVDIRTMLGYVESVEIDAAFAELQDEATVAKAEALRDLRQMLQTAEEVERQQADLARQQEELKAGHARLREQQASLPSREPAMVSQPPAVAMPINSPNDALREILDLCDELTFAADEDAQEMVERIRTLASLVLRALTT